MLDFEGGGGRGDRQPSKTSSVCSFLRVEVGVVVVVVWAKRDHPDGGGGGDKEPPLKMSRICSFSRVEVDGWQGATALENAAAFSRTRTST